MWRMLQQDEPDDYVLATGVTTTVRDLVGWAFQDAGIDLEFSGEGIDEKARCRKTGKVMVEIDPRYFRPAEVDLLIGDAGKAREKLGWEPKTSARELVSEMVRSDLGLMQKDVIARSD